MRPELWGQTMCTCMHFCTIKWIKSWRCNGRVMHIFKETTTSNKSCAVSCMKWWWSQYISYYFPHKLFHWTIEESLRTRLEYYISLKRALFWVHTLNKFAVACNSGEINIFLTTLCMASTLQICSLRLRCVPSTHQLQHHQTFLISQAIPFAERKG